MSRKRKSKNQRTIAAGVVLLFSLLIPSLLSLVGLFLSLWIVIPAPTFSLLPLAIGAPEVSPWLIGLNLFAMILTVRGIHHGWVYRIAFVCSIVAFVLSLIPLLQFPIANQQASTAMRLALGETYLSKIPQEQQAQFRSSPFALLDSFRGIPIREIRDTPNIQFAAPSNVPLRLNLYQPLQSGKYPAIVVIYGGAWRSGAPDSNEAFSRYMAARGYVVVAVDYRHAPEFRFPAQVEDIKTALNFIRQRAGEYEIDLDRVAVMGRSAGAHLAMLAAYPPESFPFRAVVNYYGPVDLTLGYRDPPNPDPIDSRTVLKAFLGGTPDQLPTAYQLASPFSYVTRPLPPSLLIYGKNDHLVQSKFGRALFDQLKAVNSQAVFIEIPWAEHAFDAVFNGLSSQLALYYTERFLASVLH
ncbi:alpha/beta hydrolase fold domain-containing protein [Phormidesmis priestleyi]